MASFTDQIQTFNPYVQQLPVDAMVQVGMQKQAQYDQGVQKIQSYIDNVAGIKTLRPSDEKYVQSKLGELGNKLKVVAAGDFSNQQLVNSVGGMATGIVKDPIIQAAMYSYSNDSKNLQEMEADKKKNELTPHAEYMYSLKRNAYLNNENLTDEQGKPITFSGKYIKGFNIEKILAEEMKGVGDGKYSVDNIFITEPDPLTGQPRIKMESEVKDPKTGKVTKVYTGPQYSEYGVREIHNGRLPESVRATVNGVLNRPEAKIELGMRGVYEYRGYDDINDFVERYEKQKIEGIKLLTENKLDIQGKLLDEKDEEKKKQLQKAILNIDNEINTLKTTTSEAEATALGYKDNLDGYKAMLYTQGIKNTFMTQYNNATVSREFMENVGLKQHQATIKAERDFYFDTENLKVSRMNAQTARLNYNLAKSKDDKENAPELPTEGGAIPRILYTEKIAEANDAEEAFTGTKKELVKQYVALLNPGFSDAQVAKQVDDWEKTYPGFTDRQYNNAKNVIQKNKGNVKYSKITSLFNQAKANENRLAVVANELTDLDKEAGAILGNKAVDFKELEKGLSPVTITYDEPDSGGFFSRNRGLFQAPKQITLNLKPADLINAAIINRAQMFQGKAADALVAQARKALEVSTGRPSQEVAGSILSRVATDGLLGATQNNKLYDQNLKIGKAVGSKVFKETLAVKEEILQKRSMGNSPVNFGLYPKGADEKTIGTINRDLTTLLNTYKTAGIDVTNYENYLAPAQGEKNKYSINIGVSRDQSTPGFTFDLYDGEKLVQSLPATYKGVSGVANRNLNIPSPVSDVSRMFNWNSKKENATNSTNSITSNPFNDSAYKGAYYTNANLNIQGAPYFLGADTYKNYSGGYNAYIYVKKGNEVVALPIKQDVGGDPVDFPSVDGADATIRSLNSKAAIDNIIKNNKD